MKVVIIKYNAGNILSVSNALSRLNLTPIITDDITQIQDADKVIFPGVGEASSAMKYLKERKLDLVIKELKQPVLGICLGLQLMCESSEENNTDCLGIFKTKVKKFTKAKKIPQIGWNKIDNIKSNLVEKDDYFYFVHSYYAECCDDTTIKSEYYEEYSAALEKNNFYAVQFHPEKSSVAGSSILEKFICLK